MDRWSASHQAACAKIRIGRKERESPVARARCPGSPGVSPRVDVRGVGGVPRPCHTVPAQRTSAPQSGRPLDCTGEQNTFLLHSFQRSSSYGFRRKRGLGQTLGKPSRAHLCPVRLGSGEKGSPRKTRTRLDCHLSEVTLRFRVGELMRESCSARRCVSTWAARPVFVSPPSAPRGRISNSFVGMVFGNLI